jgi:hypothetical protein
MPESLTGPRTLALLREVVAERPNYVYEPPSNDGRCVYVHGGACSCIASHVLHRAGATLEELERLDAAELWGGVPVANVGDYLDWVDDDAAAILDSAQAVQDDGHSWADALAAAETRAVARGIAAATIARVDSLRGGE